MTDQPGYDALADLYDETFPVGYSSAVERSAVDLFAGTLVERGLPGFVVDVGCGTGHQTQDLAMRGIRVVGADPSASMLERARARFPTLELVQDDAFLRSVTAAPVAGVLARYSLIHLPPEQLGAVLSAWAGRLQAGAVVLLAFQALSSDAPSDVEEFDHAVARAWRWRPDAMASALEGVGLAERWRIVTQPHEGYHRFPECHLLHTFD